MLALFLRTRMRRVAALTAFAILFIISGFAARALSGGSEHVEMGELYQIGGYPLVSTLLLLGWLLGRYPLIAAIVLMAGVVSEDRVNGMSRLYAVRATPLAGFYLQRYFVVAAITFALSAVLLPGFDLLMLGEWAGPSTLVLILSYIAVYGSLCFLLSAWFRNEGWITLGLAITAMLWDAVLRADTLETAPAGLRAAITLLLPPQGALFEIETAFGAAQPIPPGAVIYVFAWGAILLAAAFVSLRIREY